MLVGTIVLDGFDYGVEDVEVPAADGSGESIALKHLKFREKEGGLEIILRFTPEGFVSFVKNSQAASVVTPSGANGLPRLVQFPRGQRGR